MVPKNALAALICAGLAVAGGPAVAAEYRAGEFFGLDLSSAMLSPKRLGPATEFAPVRIEAMTDPAQVEAEASVWPKPPARKPQVARPNTEPPRAAARLRLAKRHGNPLDAQARDIRGEKKPVQAKRIQTTRIQTWPCKSGGICDWGR
jgi:hypothetical protein